MVTIKYKDFAQTGTIVSIIAGSTTIIFPTAFSAAPVVNVTPITTATATWQYSVNSVTAGSFVVYSSTAGTMNWTAVYTT